MTIPEGRDPRASTGYASFAPFLFKTLLCNSKLAIFNPPEATPQVDLLQLDTAGQLTITREPTVLRSYILPPVATRPSPPLNNPCAACIVNGRALIAVLQARICNDRSAPAFSSLAEQCSAAVQQPLFLQTVGGQKSLAVLNVGFSGFSRCLMLLVSGHYSPRS